MSDPSSVVQAAPIVSDLAPIIAPVATALATGLVGIFLALIAKYLGVQLGPDATAKLNSTADTLVQAEIAKAEDQLSTGTFNAGNPLVASLVSKLAAAEPKAVASLGLTNDQLGAKLSTTILAAIGRAQKDMTSVISPATPPASK